MVAVNCELWAVSCGPWPIWSATSTKYICNRQNRVSLKSPKIPRAVPVLTSTCTKLSVLADTFLIFETSSIMANTPPLIKFDVCIYKKERQSEEEFFNWATKLCPVKAAALIKKHGIVKWSQVRSNISMNSCSSVSNHTRVLCIRQRSQKLIRYTSADFSKLNGSDSTTSTIQGASAPYAENSHGQAWMDYS